MDNSESQTTTEMALGLKDLDEEQRCNISFLDLPRELREMIYRYIPDDSGAFTYDTRINRTKPHWFPLSVGDCQEGFTFDERFGNPGVAFGTGAYCFAILSTCRTIYYEALPMIYAVTPLGIWRPMYDYGGLTKYPTFITKVFDSLPRPANQYIRVLQIQGELWHNNMTNLLTKAIQDLPTLKILEIGLNPYYDVNQRKDWFDDRKILRQSWPAIASLHTVAQRLDSINITVSPPKDRVHIISSNHPDGVWLSGTAYYKFLWLHLQLLVLRAEITIYGALLSENAKSGMEFFMDRLLDRQDLFEVCQGRRLVDQCIAGTAKLALQDEKDWIRDITGRNVEIDEAQMRVSVVSAAREAGTKWCKMTYTLSPRGLAVPQGLMDGEDMALMSALGLINVVLLVSGHTCLS